MRGHLARKQHRPRFQGIAKINKIRQNAQKTVEIAAGLKSGREDIINEVNGVYKQIDEAIRKIKASPAIVMNMIWIGVIFVLFF